VRPTPIPASNTAVCTRRQLDALAARLTRARATNIGFPSTFDIDYTPLARFFTHHVLNNVGDPTVDGTWPNHTKAMEREVVTLVADLLRAPHGNRWGYVTSGASEGTLYALHRARRNHPDGVVYHTESAHYSVPKAAELLAMQPVIVRADQFGEMDYDDFRRQVRRRRDRPAIVVANIGTTMTEAIDDVARITGVLDDLGVHQRFVHADAALAGLPLALLDPGVGRPGFDFADGADSMIVSGHKFIGSPIPCGVLVVKTHHDFGNGSLVDYIGSPDTTITGSRSGHGPLLLWYALRHYGIDGLRRRADQCRTLAAYTEARLRDLGWESFRNEHAFTVVLRTPPPAVTAHWVLATSQGWSHIVCMPGITREQIDTFIGDLKAAMTAENGRGRTPRGLRPVRARKAALGARNRPGTSRRALNPVVSLPTVPIDVVA
jgi:histidine decarboxylase